MSQEEISAAFKRLLPPHEIAGIVARALAEDIGSGDLTAQLIPESKVYSARVISRESCVVAGMPFVAEVFRQVDPSVKLEIMVADGTKVEENAVLFRATGCARSILTAERSSLNFVQLLSGVATATSKYVKLLEGTTTRLLDTRKTLPGLRLAQKYAVVCGGGANHRIGLYDMVLIKENHIGAAGSITAAVQQAKKLTSVKVEVETESIEELVEALDAGADIVMLDEFSLEDMKRAVALNQQRAKEGKHSAKIEASGSVNTETIRGIAETGVDFISVGSLTKHVRAVDLSMRFEAH